MGIFGRLFGLRGNQEAPQGQSPVSQEFVDAQFPFVDAAITVAIDFVKHGDPLMPFVMTDDGQGTPEILPIVVHGPDGDSIVLGDDVEEAKAFAALHKGGRTVCLWDGYLTANGRRTDAIFANLYIDGTLYGFAQRYIPGSSETAARAIDDFSFFGERDVTVRKPG